MIIWAKPEYHLELKAWLATQFGGQKPDPELQQEIKLQKQTSFPEEIRKKREALGITQNKLAKLAGISRNTLVRVENGNLCCSFQSALIIAAILDLDLNPMKPPITLSGEVEKLEIDSSATGS